ncbi:MAG: FtsQ-type POTRA domain-containing protein [Anaerolineae bacterium]|nr:FtsQ-type POTRA domain-containing protein [Anaerolineae bacterium]
MLTNNRTSKKSNRRRKGKNSSSYQAVVQTYPVFRVGGRRSAAHHHTAIDAKASRTTLQTMRQATANRATANRASARSGRQARPFNLFVQLKDWLDEALHAPRAKNRRSRARLGHPKPELPNLRAAVIAPVQTAWQVGGYTAINVLFLALVGWVLFWFFTNEQFYVHEINVSGNQRVSSEAIVTASGLRNYSIFWLDAQRVARQVLEVLPPVRAVQIKYGLPNRVTLIVEEQGGQVMWQIAGINYWVDDDGQLYPAQGDVTPSVVVQDIRPGLPDSVDPEAVQAAQQLVDLLPGVEVLGYAPITGLRFRHERGWQVYLGTGDDMAYKVGILRAIEQQFAGEDTPQPSLVDLRFPDSPYYRLPDENGA